MNKHLIFGILFCCFILIHCATDRQMEIENRLTNIEKTLSSEGKGQPSQISQEKCDAPIWNVGDYWRYLNDDKKWWSLKVVGVESSFYVLVPHAGPDMYGYDKKTLGFKTHIDSKGKKTRPQSESAIFFDFPLYVGKKWSKMVEGQTTDATPSNYLFTFKVLSFENISVPAGTFKAFKIQSKQENMRSVSGGEVISYIWYSPEVKNLIKYQYDRSSGAWRISGHDYELLRFELKK